MTFSPNLLTFADGTPVTDPAQWPARRAEILDILRREEYGYSPAAPASVTGKVVSADTACCSGKAVLERVELTFDTEKGPFTFPIHLFVPKKAQPVPVFVLLHFRPGAYDKTFFPEELVDNGFGLAVIYYNDVTMDVDDWSSGTYIHSDGTAEWEDGLAGMYDRTKYTWGKIGMWAFSASRVLDYLLTRPEFDCKNAAVIGHSRLGKTALWCAAQDERFRFGISNDSGSGGAAYDRAKVEGNEHIRDSIAYAPSWYCDNYRQWVDRPEEKPFDQHFAVAAIAPRFACVGSAAEDLWAGPWQEQLSCMGASPAWELQGLPGYIGSHAPAQPGDHFAAGQVGYHLREGIHFLGRGDWLAYMDYIKAHLA